MRVYVEGYGCTQNLGEAAALGRAVEAAGHPLVHDPSAADVGVLVTCGVIGPTEARMLRRWHGLGDRCPRLIVTGCLVPLRQDLFDGDLADRTTFLPTRLQGTVPSLLDAWAATTPPSAPPPSPSPAPTTVAEEVVVAQGCTSHCTYCFSRLARGQLASVPPLDVLARIHAARTHGAREVRLSSLDTSCWGRDLPGPLSLPDLLESVGALGTDFRARVGMMSPQSLRPIAGRLFPVLSSPPFFRFLHIPVQSGSDSVLEGMRRGYAVDDFLALVREARAQLPDLMLATDVIVGFPTETESDFEATLRLVETAEPEVVNVTRFSARPLTPAARLHPLPSGVVKRRSRTLTERRMLLARRRMERWIGWEGSALVVEQGPHGSSVARLDNYLPVALPTQPALGSFVDVRVDGARSTYLVGRVVSRAVPSPN